MKSLLLTLLLLVSLVTSKRVIDSHDTMVIDYWLSAFRGMWTGYQQVLHHSNHLKVDEKCFSSDSKDEIQVILTFLVYGKLEEILDTADAVYNLFYENLQHCAIQETFNTITEKCFSSVEACSIPTIISNLEVNWLRLVQTVNGIADLVIRWWNKTLDISTGDLIYDAMFEFGSTSAEFITAFFNI